MATTTIAQYHGEVSLCDCGIYEHPEKAGERACRICFGRGFVAKCTKCEGKGQIREDMAGGPGKMWSTCNACGGVGKFGVKKPENWVDDPKPEPTETAATA